METRYIIPIFCIAVFVASSLMVIVYSDPESFGLTKPYSKIGEYDGAASDMALMINEQCLDQKQNPFKDYAFAKTSNGHYYIDNVICERINVEQGGCLEPFSKGYPDETCKNRVTFDYPYGETGPEISKEFCNQIKSEPPIITDTEQNDFRHHEYLHICTIRGMIDDDEQISFQEEDNLDLVLESCACQNDPERECFAFGASWRNSTHYIDSTQCAYISQDRYCTTITYLYDNSFTIDCNHGFENEN